MDKKMKLIALIALLAYVISPVDAIPGPVDDMIMCLLYAVMNYKGVFKELPEWKTDLWGSLSLKCLDCVKEIGYRGKKISNCSTVLTVPKRELGTKKTKSRIVPNKERVSLELFG